MPGKGNNNTEEAPKINYAFTPKGWIPPADMLPDGRRMSYPQSYSQGAARLHEITHAGYQDSLSGVNTTHYGATKNPDGSTKYPDYSRLSTEELDKLQNVRRLLPVEVGSTFNEIGQSARAFKDVTGKPLKGSYEFAPGVEMDYRELGDLAKKYKPTDLNSPAGQIFLRRILENSTGPVGSPQK